MARILLCDDSNLFLKILEKRLSEAGMQIVGSARNAEDCEKLYEDVKPDLLLLDVTMPNKDGRQCLMDIIKKHPLANVVMVSAIMDESVREECLKLGAKAFISKGHLNTEEDFNSKVLSIINQFK